MSPTRTIASLHDIIRELTQIESELDNYIDTTLWISDPHGAGDRFVSILKGRFGLVWRTCYEALPKTFSMEKIDYIGRIIRKERYFLNDIFHMDRQDIISALGKIIDYKVQNINDFDQIRTSINKDLKKTLENIILHYPVPNIVYENDLIADRIITALCKIVKQVILGHLIVLGDVFDRGDEPDKIIRILNKSDIRRYVTFIWGNHDILWMGAAAGNRSMIAQALRISTRYDNLDFLKRLKIDISPLEQLGEKLYPDGVSCNVKAKNENTRKMEKTLAIIQFKLEEQAIRENPEFEMESRLWLNRLSQMLEKGDTGGLTDTHFPTIDPNNPGSLSADEKEVIDDLARQFTSSDRVQYLMKYLFEYGKMYHVHNYIVNIHALIPSTKDADFQEFNGRKGRQLLEYIQNTVKNVGKNYLNGMKQNPKEIDLMFYLWCGPRSPFFGKDAMKTFERYFLSDKSTHKETLLYWDENIKKKEFMDKIMQEFGAERIVYGHTPVNVLKGEKIASPDGRAINIDGGFSEAYLNRGHSLIQTPYSLYAIILPTPEEIQEARKKKEHVNFMTEIIDYFETPLRIRDTYNGTILMKRRDELRNMLADHIYINGS